MLRVCGKFYRYADVIAASYYHEQGASAIFSDVGKRELKVRR